MKATLGSSLICFRSLKRRFTLLDGSGILGNMGGSQAAVGQLKSDVGLRQGITRFLDAGLGRDNGVGSGGCCGFYGLFRHGFAPYQ
jgi:hypothetical protein